LFLHPDNKNCTISSNGTAATPAQPIWSFTGVVLAGISNNASGTNDSAIAQPDVQGLLLLPPPDNTSASYSTSAIAWLASGAWLVPQALLGCSTLDNAAFQGTGTSTPVLQLYNVTMLVTPHSLMQVQEALCTAAAVASVPPNVTITKV
jgi:hypothetical protein